MPDLKQYLVTRTETITVGARSEEEALFLGEQGLDFYGTDTSDIQAEELDLEDTPNLRGKLGGGPHPA